MSDVLSREKERTNVKVVIVGDSGVGKSNLISRYMQDKFLVGNNTTIGLEFNQKDVSFQGQNLCLDIWDTAGQQRFRALNKTYYKNSQGALVVFSLVDRESFLSLEQWISELRQNVSEDTVLLLLGNKCDLKQQKVTVAEAIEFAKLHQMGYLQTSAALNINVKEAFTLLLSKIVKVVDNRSLVEPPQKVDPVKINIDNCGKIKRTRCC